MTKHVHNVSHIRDHSFIKQKRKDPFTRQVIKAGDRVVFCAICKAAFLVNSWEAIDNQHCNQQNTLRDFPPPLEVLDIRTKWETPDIHGWNASQVQAWQREVTQNRNELDELRRVIKSKKNKLKQNKDKIDDKLSEAKIFSMKRKYNEFIKKVDEIEELFNQHEKIQGVSFHNKEHYFIEIEKLKETASTKFKRIKSLHEDAHQLLMGAEKLEYDTVSLKELNERHQQLDGIFDEIRVLSQDTTETIEQQYREALDELKQSIKSKEKETQEKKREINELKKLLRGLYQN